jgi:excisionase family DNA binding protein
MARRKDLAPKDAAQMLGIRLDSVYAQIWAGRLEAHKLDGRWRIPLASVEARLRAKEVANGTAGR